MNFVVEVDFYRGELKTHTLAAVERDILESIQILVAQQRVTRLCYSDY